MPRDLLDPRDEEGGERYTEQDNGKAIERPFGEADLRADHGVEQTDRDRIGRRADQGAQPTDRRSESDPHWQRARQSFTVVSRDPATCEDRDCHRRHD